MKYSLKFFKYLINLNPELRRLLLLSIDILILIIAIFSSLWVANIFKVYDEKLIIIFYPIIAISFYLFTGHYDGLTTYTGGKSFYRIGFRNFFQITIFYSFLRLANINITDLRFWINLFIFSSLFTGLIRIFIRDLLLEIKKKKVSKRTKVAIYGAGDAGAQLAANLNSEGNYIIKFFVDDNERLYKRTINGISIKSPNFLKKNHSGIDKILFAIPSCNSLKRKEIINNIKIYNIPILQVPSVKELTSGKAEISSLRPIEIEELLMRNPISPNPKLLKNSIENKVIFVTGGGGSIGGEICRQIVKLKPKKLILLELSEINLYEIKSYLLEKNYSLSLKFVLGSACNYNLIENILKEEKVDVIYHCAAYKHVPLIEENELEGIANNVLSTYTLCKAANNNNVSKFILISTDKAVRPTNVMGASKRLAEMIVQANANSNNSYSITKKNKDKTCFSMVRFGNVLDSSGSVVPLFRKQIYSKGVITVTHPNVIRYFMTITEAAHLVLQASALSEGGEVFLLDMGKPIKIYELAKYMITLSGFKLKDEENPDGDIEIKFIGLRPGEKLYEELLIDGQAIPTTHPLIYKAIEKFMHPDDLWPKIKSLEDQLEILNKKNTLKILKNLVPEWTSN